MRFLIINSDTGFIAEEHNDKRLAELASAKRNKEFVDMGDIVVYHVQPTCPQCDDDDVHRGHSDATHTYPETDYWYCGSCSHTWGHE